jgi:diguanylate cyclase (GGDEF)-like protein
VGFAVLYLDLDHFKDVNDTLGHPVGDILLQEVAERLQSNTREADTVARFGGDEFAVVVAEAGDPADAAILADKLISILAKPYSIQANDIYSGASMGIDLYGPDACDAETLLSHADIALYRAKSEGRGGYRFFTDVMDAEVRMQVSLGTELHQALDSGQFYLEYQPQVAIDGARIVGVEALVRWRHPQRGILGPGRFIPVAEKSGVIVKLGHWVLMTACRQAKVWLDSGLAIGRIAVNLSAVQFQSPIALEADIADVLADTGLPPQLLELELTETVLMNASREHGDIILRLRRLGVTIAIDDFGTGYSSLDYLRRYPADRIKIAQNFVQHLESVPGDVSIVKATIGLAHELGINVIAEGVETREQLELLENWGCNEVQGFYFARPLAEQDVTLLLRNGGILQPGTGSLD